MTWQYFPPAVKDEMDVVIALTVGKCLQTILVVIPFVVLLSWIIGRDMSLSFDTFEVVALLASVRYINAIIQTGKPTYLDGVLLLSVFLIICLTSCWVPGTRLNSVTTSTKDYVRPPAGLNIVS